MHMYMYKSIQQRTCCHGNSNYTIHDTYLDKTGVTNDLLRLHHVYERLLQGHVSDAAHVEAIDAIPPCREGRGSMSSG